MSLFGRWADLNTFQVIADLRGHFNVTDAHWTAFAATVGDFRNDVRLRIGFSPNGATSWMCPGTVPRRYRLYASSSNSDWTGVRPAKRVVAFSSGMLEAEF